MSAVNPQKVHECISRFRGIDDARTLYCTLLNYEYENLPIPTENWSRSAREIIVDGRIIAKKSDFYVLYFIICKLTRTNERIVLREVLKHFPDCVVIFSDRGEEEFHITSPKYEPESRYKFVVRRYVVGKYEKLRTAAERLCMTYASDTDTATELKAKHDEAFNVEAVTKEFYEKYKEILALMEEHLKSQRIGDEKTARGFAQQFLNRLMFLYFIQKKGWLNNDRQFFRNLVRRYKNEGGTPNGIYRDWIEPLFFYSFNKKPIPDSFNLPSDMIEIYNKMPYLNGGLFLRNELDEIGYELDDSVVFKVFDDLLERFNFTVSEDTPFDVDVAVDPEMLGKVYESLIHEEERGEAGIFYTPRVEVDFICRQSILEYLMENTDVSHEKLISFIYSTEEDRADLLSKEEAKAIGNALYRAKIVDPACGSGAFLVGMLHVLMELYIQILKRLDVKLNLFEVKKEIINNNLYGADIKDWAVRVAELRLWLTLLVETEESEIKLDAKKPLLPNLTFKLRCGDSLVQEIGGKPLGARAMMTHLDPICRSYIKELYEEKRKYYYSRTDDPDVLARIKKKEVEIVKMLVDSEIKRIEFRLRHLAAMQQRLDAVQVAITASEIERAKEREKLEKEKERLKVILEKLESEEAIRKFFWEIDFAEVFADGGFDIVIANPPYVRQEKIAPLAEEGREITKEMRKAYKEALVRSVKAQWGEAFKKDLKSDLYVYFYYLGLSLLKPGGVLCFISSNSWLDVGFGAKLQEFLLKNIEVKAIYDNHAKRTFAEADINTVIVMLKRPKEKKHLPDNLVKFVAFKKPFEEVLNEKNMKAIANARGKLKTDDFRCFPITQAELWKEGLKEEQARQTEISGGTFIGEYAGSKWGGKYLRAPDIFFTILEKGKGKFVRLGDIAEVRRGFTTGANEFFYLTEEQIKAWGIEREFWMHPLRKWEEPPVAEDVWKDKGGEYFKNSQYAEDFSLEEVLRSDGFVYWIPNYVIKSPRECKSIVINPKDLKFRVLMIHKDKKDLKGTNTLKYIQWGEEQGLHKRPTCKPRKRWYELGEFKGDLLCMMSLNDRHIFWINSPQSLIDARFYGIYLKRKESIKSVGALLNCSFAPIFVELIGRVNLGQGALDVKVYEYEKMFVINPFNLTKSQIEKLEKALDKLSKRLIGSVFEELGADTPEEVSLEKVKPNRRELDCIVMGEILGLSEEEQLEVYRAVIDLVRSRLEKARSVKKEVRR